MKWNVKCKTYPDGSTNTIYCTFTVSFDILGLYGDIRYSDGSEYPTDDDFVYGTIHNFAEKAMQNDLINAKRDIFYTACNNFRQGYKTSTTVKQLYEKYNKQFPQFTKEFLNEAVHKSIIKYLQTQ